MLTSAALVYGASNDNPWPGFRNPAPGPSRSIGDYAGGCLQGAQALPLDGPGYQVMRPSRRRFFGHPALVDFVRQLGRHMHNQQGRTLLIGDLAQARGGRAASGHASHQTGLDVDIWYTHPDGPPNKRLSPVVREDLKAGNVVDLKHQTIVPRWKKRVAVMLRLSAEDPRVDRVFVNPVIKDSLCRQPGARGPKHAWLRKIRPWFGHDDHFHVRLGCPASDIDCKPQASLPPGDGCDKLTSWLRPKRALPRAVVVQKAPVVRKAPPPALVQYRKSIAEGNGWPERCNALLEPEHSETGRLARSDVR